MLAGELPRSRVAKVSRRLQGQLLEAPGIVPGGSQESSCRVWNICVSQLCLQAWTLFKGARNPTTGTSCPNWCGRGEGGHKKELKRAQ